MLEYGRFFILAVEILMDVEDKKPIKPKKDFIQRKGNKKSENCLDSKD